MSERHLQLGFLWADAGRNMRQVRTRRDIFGAALYGEPYHIARFVRRLEKWVRKTTTSRRC